MNKPALSALVAFLWAVDTVATCVFVSKFGVEAEANPLMAYVIETFGLVAFVFLKAGVIVFFLSVGKHMPKWLLVLVALFLLPVAVAGLILAWS